MGGGGTCNQSQCSVFFLFVFRFAADEVAEAEQVDSGLVATPDHTSSPTITSTPVVKVGR